MPDLSLLKVNNLKVEFATDRSKILAVDGVDISLKRGKTLGLVGESGCGKSVTALAIMALLPRHASISGEVFFKERDLLKLQNKDMTKIRGNQISMIFQEPMTSLNPVYTVGDQIMEAIMIHQKVNKKQALTKAIEALNMVRIPSPEKRVNEYPHQLSGGMCQRVMIAMSLVCNPEILIADEPTTALDVTIQAQILKIVRALKDELGTAVILITHDLGVIAEMAQRVAVWR